MRAVILYNPNAGRGRGERVAQGAAAMLRSRGLTVDLIATAKEPPDLFLRRLAATITGADLLVIAGGDGTLHHALPALISSGVPIYHLAMGTENLFARQFGMDRLPETLDKAVAAWKVVDVDAGLLTVGTLTQNFLLMCSMGPDASVIRRLDDARRGPISHLSYFKHILAELAHPWLPRITIEVDGKPLVCERTGMVVIANSRQYALRVDPAAQASMSDGLLDVVFLPCRTGLGAAARLVRSHLRSHGPAVVYAQGASVSVKVDTREQPALQVDGECLRPGPGLPSLSAQILGKAVRVLVP